MTPPDVWIRHRKLCKKRASAKWYVKKKQAEITEQKQHRRQLAELFSHKLTQPIFSLEQQAHNRCYLAHRCFGYPMRPIDESVWLWDYWKDCVEEQLDLCRHTFPDWCWSDDVLVALRRLGIQERRHHHSGCMDGLARFRIHMEGPSRFVSVLVGPVGWMWVRLQQILHDSSVWPRWIQAIQRMYSRQRCQANTASTPIPINGNSTTPTTNPNQKDHQATQISDSSCCDNEHLCISCSLRIQPSWYYKTEAWNHMIKGFDEWLAKQPPKDLEIDTQSSHSLDSQSSLDSSLVREIFGNECPATPPIEPADSQPSAFPGYFQCWSDEDYDSSDEPI